METDIEVRNSAKKPWQNINLRGDVEAEYLYATMLGRQLLPFGFTDLSLVVLPIEDKLIGLNIVNKEMALGKGHTCLYDWLIQVEKLWDKYKKTGNKSTVYQWLDYMRKLTSQHPTGYHTVVYNRVGTNLASCVISPTSENGVKVSGINVNGFVADIDTFLFQTQEESEAHYLCAFLNAPSVDNIIKPHQTKGQWGERDIARRPFEVIPIPKYDPADDKQKKLAGLSKECHREVAKLSLKGKSIGFLRNKVRDHLSSELGEIDELVKTILA